MQIQIGNKFGKLLVQERFLSGNGHKEFICLCDCGNQKIVRGTSLLSGNTRSCGCLHSQARTHGMTKTPTYKTWQLMKNRCLNRRDSHYPNYGGRGITVCERWLTFENFLADMGERPQGMELDRICNSSSYRKDNCRWVTKQENIKNKDNNFKKLIVSLTDTQLEKVLLCIRGEI